MAVVKVSDVKVGSLVKYHGKTFLRPYSHSPLWLLHVFDDESGHGYTSPNFDVEVICKPSEFNLIPVLKGVITGDMGKALSADDLRAALDAGGGLPASTGGDRDSSVRRGVHRCSCVDCPGHKILI